MQAGATRYADRPAIMAVGNSLYQGVPFAVLYLRTRAPFPAGPISEPMRGCSAPPCSPRATGAGKMNSWVIGDDSVFNRLAHLSRPSDRLDPGVLERSEGGRGQSAAPGRYRQPQSTLQDFVVTMDGIYRGMKDILQEYAASQRLYLTPDERRRQVETPLPQQRRSGFWTFPIFPLCSNRPSPPSGRSN